MKVQIRDALPADMPAILDLWGALMAFHARLDPVLYAVADNGRANYAAFIRRLRTDRDGLTLVATHNDTVVGYLAGGSGQRAPVYAVRDVGMIFDLSVAPRYRRAGVGRQLTAEALAHFRRRGLPVCQVNFSPRNPTASGFWQDQGFQVFLQEAYLKLE